MSTTVRVTPAEFAPPGIVDRFRTLSMVVGALFAAVAIVVAALNFKLFLQSYLVGFMFWLGVTLGSLALLMLQYTSGGNWGIIGRRYWEAAGKTLPFMFVLWLPLVFGMRILYPWSHMKPEELVADRAKFYL